MAVHRSFTPEADIEEGLASGKHSKTSGDQHRRRWCSRRECGHSRCG